jgi:hypothetical protein
MKCKRDVGSDVDADAACRFKTSQPEVGGREFSEPPKLIKRKQVV